MRTIFPSVSRVHLWPIIWILQVSINPPILCNPMDARLPCPSSIHRQCSNSCPLSQWCHPTISCSVIPFSSCLQSFPASGSFPVIHIFTSGDQSIGVPTSPSVLPMNIQDWFPLGMTGLISLLFKGLLRIFSNTMVQNHQFFSTQVSLISKWLDYLLFSQKLLCQQRSI